MSVQKQPAIKMTPAIDIARQLVLVGADPQHPEESSIVCPLRLQKLLYYCQGWALGLLAEPLFPEPLEAWRHGPVVRSVYDRFKGQLEPITTQQIGLPQTLIPSTSVALVEMVWSRYAGFTPKKLAEMTHHEPAWLEARGDLATDAGSDRVLNLVTMRNHFQDYAIREARKSVHPGQPFIDPTETWKAELAYELSGRQSVDTGTAYLQLMGEQG